MPEKKIAKLFSHWIDHNRFAIILDALSTGKASADQTVADLIVEAERQSISGRAADSRTARRLPRELKAAQNAKDPDRKVALALLAGVSLGERLAENARRAEIAKAKGLPVVDGETTLKDDTDGIIAGIASNLERQENRGEKPNKKKACHDEARRRNSSATTADLEKIANRYRSRWYDHQKRYV